MDPADLTLQQALLLLGQVHVLGMHPRMGLEMSISCPPAHRNALLMCGSIVQRISKVCPFAMRGLVIYLQRLCGCVCM